MGKARYLNDDIFFNVLSQLPTKILVGLKCVSKGWKSLISDRRFIQAQLRKTEVTVSGFIFQEKFQWYEEDIKTVSYIPVEKASFEVKQNVFDFLPEDIVVLASCDGLVCCRSCFPSEDPAIYICNPVNKEFVTLRCAGLDRDSSVALAFDPSQELVDTSTNFKVVRARQFEIEEGEEEDLYFTFEIYSSKAGEWRKSNEICKCNTSLSKNKGVYIGGILHWLTDGDNILTFDSEKELSWLISVPVPASEFKSIPQACIGESDGRLHYVMISEEGLHLWCLEDYFESKWALKYSKPLRTMEKEHPRLLCNLHERVMSVYDTETPWVNPLAFKDGLLLMVVSAKIYLYHFETSKVQVVCEAFKLGSSSIFFPTVLPYSMSLVPLLSTVDELCS